MSILEVEKQRQDFFEKYRNCPFSAQKIGYRWYAARRLLDTWLEQQAKVIEVLIERGELIVVYGLKSQKFPFYLSRHSIDRKGRDYG